jgi:hypothetical protein
MKIVDRKTFLFLPSGVVFAKFNPHIFGELLIKGDTIGDNDFSFQSIVDAVDAKDSGEYGDILWSAVQNGDDVNFDFDCMGRDGQFDEDQLFSVWSKSDVEKLISRLQDTL